jgi:hypothetical protein
MSFSRAQQPAFRKLVKEAWIAVCKAEGRAAAAAPDRCWYEQELYLAVGQTSTTECNAGRDYDLAMAHFEGLAGAGIAWQMRVHSGDAKRLLHELSEVTHAHDIDEDYLRSVARRMLRTEHLPELAHLSRPQLILILGEMKRYVRRRLKREAEIPF